MTKLSTWVKYNNYDNLCEHLGFVGLHNFTSLLVGSVKYHSKECFDMLIDLPNAKIWINERQRGIKHIFTNYEKAPNESNEHYINKVLPLLAYLSTYSMKEIVSNSLMLDKVFDRIKKDKYSILDLLINIIQNSSLDEFTKVFDYLKSNQTKYSFFTDQWIQSNLIAFVLFFDNLDIIKYFDEKKLIPEYLQINNNEISTLLLALTSKKNIRLYRRGLNKKENTSNVLNI